VGKGLGKAAKGKPMAEIANASSKKATRARLAEPRPRDETAVIRRPDGSQNFLLVPLNQRTAAGD
jgi:hypothetical protein